jgi:membrane-bound serine protease (ClpP class)
MLVEEDCLSSFIAMKLVLLLGILGLIVTLSLLIVLALFLHKKASRGNVYLVGEIGSLTTSLDPEGAVLVRGELWRARSGSGIPIPAHLRVRVTGTDGHLLIVESF